MEAKEFDRNFSLIKWSSDPWKQNKKQRQKRDITVYLNKGSKLVRKSGGACVATQRLESPCRV